MHKETQNKIVIVGTGLAGYMFAKEFRKQDTVTQLLLITKSDGYFYSKPLLSTALTSQKTPDELCINSVDSMRQQLNAEILIRCDVFKIDSICKTVFFRDKENGAHSVIYEKLILANGADNVSISLEGDAVNEVISVNQLEDYRIFREKLAHKKRVAILGVGLVGCEFANDLINTNHSVSMIAPDHYLLNSLVPEAVSLALQQAFLKAGIVFYQDVFPKEINRKNSNYEIMLSNQQKITVDFVFSAVGIQPNLTLAKSANIKTNIGIVANSYCQTSDPDIYALGDCAEVNGQLTMYVAPILQNVRNLAAFLCDQQLPTQNTVMPIIIKTPLCPIVIAPASKNLKGEWKVISDDGHVQALFYDENNQLRGFALSGNCVKEKMRLLKLMAEAVVN